MNLIYSPTRTLFCIFRIMYCEPWTFYPNVSYSYSIGPVHEPRAIRQGSRRRRRRLKLLVQHLYLILLSINKKVRVFTHLTLLLLRKGLYFISKPKEVSTTVIINENHACLDSRHRSRNTPGGRLHFLLSKWPQAYSQNAYYLAGCTCRLRKARIIN